MNRLSAPSWTRWILWLILVFLYVPFIWMVIRAFGGPSDWGLEWFAAILNNEVWIEALGRSFLVALAASFMATLLGLGAAVASRSFLKPFLEIFSIVALVLPELVFALSLLTWFVWLGLELSLLTVILAHVTFSVSFAYFLILSRYRQIDESLLEAAADLGATPWQIFRKILLPLLSPSLGVAFLLCFLLSFDDFLISFFVSGAGSDTLPVKLYSSMKVGLSPQLQALATLMSIFSAALLFLLLKSSFVRNLISRKPVSN